MAADGRDYMRPEAVFDAGNAGIEAYLASRGAKAMAMRVENFRQEMADRLRALCRERVQYTVLEPDARTKAILGAQGRERPAASFYAILPSSSHFPLCSCIVQWAEDYMAAGG